MVRTCGEVRREGMIGARKIRNDKLREHHYREVYARFLEGKRVEWNGDDNVVHMWEQVKWQCMKGQEKCVAQ